MAEIICGIYKITSPTGKVYIGQSVNIKDRWRRYNNGSCKTQRKLFNSFQKHGLDNHVFEIVCTCEESKLNDLEKYYIDLFQTFNTKHGMNLRDGGGSRARHSEITKQRMSIASMGKKRTPEQIENHRAKMLGRKLSESHRKSIAAGNTGRIVSEETRRKLSLAHTGKKMSPESIEKMSLSRRGRKLSEQHRLNISKGSIGRSYNKRSGYICNNTKPFSVIDNTTGEQRTFRTQPDAIEFTGVSVRTMSRYLSGQTSSKRFSFIRTA